MPWKLRSPFSFLTKRQRIVLATLFVTVALMATQRVSVFEQQRYVIVVPLCAFVLSLWALWQGMNRVKLLMLLTLPVLYSLGVAVFIFLLQTDNFVIKFIADCVFGLTFYFLLLSENIFNVAAQRTIPLYRAASTAAFLFTIVTAISLFQIVHVLSLSFLYNGIIVALISFFLLLPMLWSIEMEHIQSRDLLYSLILAVIVGEFALALSFWPIPPDSLIWSVLLGTVLFILLGISLDIVRESLTKTWTYLYMGLGVFLLCVAFFTTHWSG